MERRLAGSRARQEVSSGEQRLCWFPGILYHSGENRFRGENRWGENRFRGENRWGENRFRILFTTRAKIVSGRRSVLLANRFRGIIVSGG